MSKVFTITEGLQNMGALKTGGQGSVYKGKRIGEIITAVKLLPTPVIHESREDKHYASFINEVQKLKKVNEEANPNVVKIISSGITETGSFPFIEMEFIEGPDLEELLQPPHQTVFTIKETMKVAEQLAHALAHCHKLQVRHGDIKSNNVKYNKHTGNYVLLDFGLAVMSDEERRTSLRHAGAIEFMAPEQNEGQMLYETDVYSYGVILYELLAGTVPFPLTEKGETARNNVRVAHMETAPPDILQLRKNNLPQGWEDNQKAREMHLPEWLLQMIYKCLQKKPEDRFANGMQLYDYLYHHTTNALPATIINPGNNARDTAVDKNELNNKVAHYQRELKKKDEELALLATLVSQKDNELQNIRLATRDNPYAQTTAGGSVSKAAFFTVLAIALALGAFAAYSLFFQNNTSANNIEVVQDSTNTFDSSLIDPNEMQAETMDTVTKPAMPIVKPTPAKLDTMPAEQPADTATTDGNAVEIDTTSNHNVSGLNKGEKELYKVVANKAFFHTSPTDASRRNAYIVHWNDAVVTALNEENGFVYVIFRNHAGQISKGWLRKTDLKEMN